MNFMRVVTPKIAIGDQPTEADLAELKKEGFSGIINLRNDGEPDQPMNTAQEGEKARAVGLDYLHYGVGSAPLSAKGVTAVCDFIDQHGAGDEQSARPLPPRPQGDRTGFAATSPGQQVDRGRSGRQGQSDGSGGRRRSEDAGGKLFERNVELIWSVLVNKLRPEEWGKISLSVGTSPEEIKAT